MVHSAKRYNDSTHNQLYMMCGLSMWLHLQGIQDDGADEFGTKYGDSVIEDNYFECILTYQFDIDYACSMFDKSKCLFKV